VSRRHITRDELDAGGEVPESADLHHYYSGGTLRKEGG